MLTSFNHISQDFFVSSINHTPLSYSFDFDTYAHMVLEIALSHVKALYDGQKSKGMKFDI